jgi:endonuclease-3
MEGAERSREIARRLREAYGMPRRGRDDPGDVLIRTVLSQNTSDVNSHRAFARLEEAFPTMEDLSSADLSDIEDAIRVGGLYERKARIIRDLAGILAGSPVDMASMGSAEAREYLRSLGGVGPKTASCVLLFALGRDVLPVDTHVYRLARRLGLVSEGTPIGRAEEELESFVPEEVRYEIHINLIRHGRSVCRPSSPKCNECVLLDLCPYGISHIKGTRS